MRSGGASVLGGSGRIGPVTRRALAVGPLSDVLGSVADEQEDRHDQAAAAAMSRIARAT